MCSVPVRISSQNVRLGWPERQTRAHGSGPHEACAWTITPGTCQGGGACTDYALEIEQPLVEMALLDN